MPRQQITTNLTTSSNGRARTIEQDHADDVQFHATTEHTHVRVKLDAKGGLLVQVLRMVDGEWKREHTIDVPAPTPVVALTK